MLLAPAAPPSDSSAPSPASPPSDSAPEPEVPAGPPTPDPGHPTSPGPEQPPGDSSSLESPPPTGTPDASDAAPGSDAPTAEPPSESADPEQVEPPPPMCDPDDDIEADRDAEEPPREAQSDEPKIRGLIIQMGVGLTQCPQDFCSANVMGGLGRFELGYRRGWLEVLGTVAGGGGPGEEGGDTEGIRFLDVAAGVLAFPVREGPVDPFLGVSLGYARSIRLTGDTGLIRQYSKRGAVRFSGGILWKVRPRVALGPRVDVRLPFAGQWCSRFDDGMEDQCISIRDEILEPLSGESKRGARRAFPRPWSFTLDLRISI